MNSDNNIPDGHTADLDGILARWEIADPGQAFFTLLPSRIQQRAAARRHPAFGMIGLLMPAFTAAAAVIIAVGLWNVHSQTMAAEKLVSEAAAWSVEDRTSVSDIPAGAAVDAQAAGLDESLGTAVERLSIDTKSGYQLLDGLGPEEMKQVVSELNGGKG